MEFARLRRGDIGARKTPAKGHSHAADPQGRNHPGRRHPQSRQGEGTGRPARRPVRDSRGRKSRPARAGRDRVDLHRQRPAQGPARGAAERPDRHRRRLRPVGGGAGRLARHLLRPLGRTVEGLRRGHEQGRGTDHRDRVAGPFGLVHQRPRRGLARRSRRGGRGPGRWPAGLPWSGRPRLRLRPDFRPRRLQPDFRRDGPCREGRHQPPRPGVREAEGRPVLTDPQALGVYVHWPYCAKICPYCDFNVVRDRRQAEQADLADAILADLEAQRTLTGPRRLVSVFLGGGTPSLMDPQRAADIVATARRLWEATPDLEVSLEANPTDAEAGRFGAFRAAGVTRLSLGLQSFDDEALKFLGRNHDAAEARRAATLAARTFPRLSVDMIYALPGQTVAAWTDQLRAAIALGAEHVSPYQLTIEAGTAFDRAVGRGQFKSADDETGAALYAATQSVLEAAGFEAYEVSNHARGAAARSRHNLVYWRGQDYVGVGPGAHGRLALHGVRTATEAARKVGDYIGQVRETGLGFRDPEALSPVEAAEERLLMGLRTYEGVGIEELAALGLTASHPAVAGLVEQGLLAEDPQRLRATPAGRFVLDGVTRALIVGAS
ncbi:MAG: coproporphyrinogen III oxidase [Caulobacterales bacterium]|nr:coproporphyrinogen III oxidase [Caulobacterales bacterium]